MAHPLLGLRLAVGRLAGLEAEVAAQYADDAAEAHDEDLGGVGRQTRPLREDGVVQHPGGDEVERTGEAEGQEDGHPVTGAALGHTLRVWPSAHVNGPTCPAAPTSTDRSPQWAAGVASPSPSTPRPGLATPSLERPSPTTPPPTARSSGR